MNARAIPGLGEIREFLRVPTPQRWVSAALADLELLLIDHANCEKKAAGTALSLLMRYVDRPELLQQLSRLAREELRHFEQVAALLSARGIEYRHIGAARYAGELRRLVASDEPWRLVDTLLVGAIVEARSCERFALVADALEPLDPELAEFYRRLLDSEARHYAGYLALARQYAPEADDPTDGTVDGRLARLLAREAELVVAGDSELRFHSGPPERATG
ncbi:MAG: tRNA-(ms[2]io[6]A)-hydroxylase [Planctomycetota bacterium]